MISLYHFLWPVATPVPTLLSLWWCFCYSSRWTAFKCLDAVSVRLPHAEGVNSDQFRSRVDRRRVGIREEFKRIVIASFVVFLESVKIESKSSVVWRSTQTAFFQQVSYSFLTMDAIQMDECGKWPARSNGRLCEWVCKWQSKYKFLRVPKGS